MEISTTSFKSTGTFYVFFYKKKKITVEIPFVIQEPGLNFQLVALLCSFSSFPQVM